MKPPRTSGETARAVAEVRKTPNYQSPAMNTYYLKNGKRHDVKNLGWINKRKSQIKSIELQNRKDGARCGGNMICFLHSGEIYYATWNSENLLREWVEKTVKRHGPEVRDYLTAHSTSNP